MTARAALRVRRRTDTDAVGWLSAYLLLLLLIPSRLVVGPLGSAGAPSMLFGLGSLFLWLLLFVSVVSRSSGRAEPIRTALGLFLLCVGVTFVLAMSRPLSSDEVSPASVALLSLASWSGTMLLTHDGLYTRSRLDLLLWRFVLCGGVIAVLGLVQIATGQLWVDRLSMPGLTSAPAYGLVDRGGFPRPSGTSIHPIEFGVLLAMLLPLALHVGLFHGHRPPWLRWAPAVALGAVIPVTSSRSAYLGAALGLGICVAGWPRTLRWRLFGLAGTGLVAMTFITPNFLNSVLGLFTGAGEDPSITSRTQSFTLAFEFVERNPWFGRGLGTFLPKYRIFDNQYLLLLVTVGILGTVVFLGIALTAVVVILQLRRTLTDARTRDLCLSLVAAICAGFSCLIMFDAFAFPMTMGSLFVVLGLAGALRGLAGEQSPVEPVP